MHSPVSSLSNIINSRKYNKFGRTYLFDLDFYFLREGKGKEEGKQEEEWEPKYVVDAYHAGNVSHDLSAFHSVAHHASDISSLPVSWCAFLLFFLILAYNGSTLESFLLP